MRPFFWCSVASIVVMRNPLSTKNTPSATHDPGRVWKLEWKINTRLTPTARMPVSAGRSPSRKGGRFGGSVSPSAADCTAAADNSVGIESSR